MTKLQFLFLPILLMVPTINAHADIFTCRDSAGHLITSDRVVAECADKATQVYTNSGVLKDRLAGALTPEQRRASELQEQERTRQSQQVEQAQKEQRYLTAHYPSEQDIETARQRELDIIEAKILEEKKSIDATTEALNKNRDEQTRIPKKQVVDLAKAKSEEDNLVQTLQLSERLIQRYTAEKSNVNRQFDATHKRYLEIVGANKK